MKNIFGKDKIEYKNIEIFEELETIITKNIDYGKSKSVYNIKLLSKVIIACIVFTTVLFNLFPKFSVWAQDIPVLGNVAYFFTINKSNIEEESEEVDILFRE
ncbi:MAG: hypothetical protein IJO26_05275 [Clostridium sp.]|nr:hypothetical protein [Clostridium sp.]